MKLKNIPQYIPIILQKWLRTQVVMFPCRRRLKNNDFSIIASTCNGGVLCSDLGVRFNSPTVNLWMNPEDFLRMVSNLRAYMNYDLINVTDDTVPYPVGELHGDVRIYFQHYRSFEEAKEKWEERKKRINYDNLFIMFTDRNGCTDEQLERFDELPFQHKIVFTCKPHPNLKSCIWCQEYHELEEVPVLTTYRHWWGERLYDRYFDFVGWLNGQA